MAELEDNDIAGEDLPQLAYDRLCRTPQSEAYMLADDDGTVGRVDLHFGTTTVYAGLSLERDFSEQEIRDLIRQIDEDLIWTADTPREDLVVTVYKGTRVGVFAESIDEMREEAEATGEN